jgi:SNF2 family DNA or RNA helicase
MTGTPVENRLTDLWAIMDFVQPGFLGTSAEFHRNFVSKRKERQTGEANTTRLRRTIGHRMLRRMKESTLENMPDKHLHPEGWNGYNLHRWSLPLTDAQMRAIEDFQLQFERDCANPEVDAAGARLRAIEGFRRVADHPLVADKRLIPIMESPVEELIEKSAKLQVAIEVIHQVKAADEKVIIFSGIRLSQQLLARIVSEKFGIEPRIINGDTPITSSRSSSSRQGIIEEYSKKQGFDVLILSPLAAGVGLNITAANHVIHFTRHWNPAKEAQATDRAYRIGQKKPVHIYYPMSLSETFQSFDSVLHLLLERKQSLASSTLTPTQDLSHQEFTGLLQNTTSHE